jgi:hypothetical protein
MKQWITIVVLVALLAGGGAFGWTKIVSLTEKIYELEAKYTTLQFNHNSLQSNYNSLDANFKQLKSDYNSLVSNYNSLDSNYQQLKSNHDSLASKYNSLEADYKSLQSDNDALKGKVSTLWISNSQLEAEKKALQNSVDQYKRLIDQYEKVPHSYYSAGGFTRHSNTVEELFKFLTLEFVLPRNYQLNIFDCSESSAYLEWALENAGFSAKIAIGPAPTKPTEYHAWVIAYTQEYQVAIEATALTGEFNLLYLLAGRIPGVIFSDDPLVPNAKNYYTGYDRLLQNIYDAVRNDMSVEEWNWWEGF